MPGLDDVTILRYAHVYRERVSGGIEQYLRQLDGGLLERYRLTILQTHLVDPDAPEELEIEPVGLGRIIWVPIRVRQSRSRIAGLTARARFLFRRGYQEHRLRQESVLASTMTAAGDLFGIYRDHLRYPTSILSERLPRMLSSHHVDLLVLHWYSYDAGSLVKQARQLNTPIALVNHFENGRLGMIAHVLEDVSAIGTVSARHIPDALRSKCTNVSDAIDTEFFHPDRAGRSSADSPVVLLPARIQAGKGHEDLLRAALVLRSRGKKVEIHFAGAADSETVREQIQRFASAEALQVKFLGERSREDLRDLYALSSLVVLPSHSEGLPRVLLEAQAMQKPVVAYDTGGVPEALEPNTTGLLVRHGDIVGLADAIESLLDTEEMRQSFGIRGREFVIRGFGAQALLNRHERLYLQALNSVRGHTQLSQGEPSLAG